MKLTSAVPALLVLGFACGRIDSDAAGDVNSIVRCNEDGTCQTGFRCVQQICVTDEVGAAGGNASASGNPAQGGTVTHTYGGAPARGGGATFGGSLGTAATGDGESDAGSAGRSEDDAGAGGSPGDTGAGGASSLGGRLAKGGAATGGTTSARGGVANGGADAAARAGGEEPVCSDETVVPTPFECLPQEPSQSHQITVLGTLDDTLRWGIAAPYAFAEAINAHGVVLVAAHTCSDSRGAVFENGELRALEPPSTAKIEGRGCYGRDINDDGDIVGTCGMNGVPVIWRAGVPEVLATHYADALPRMINNAGTIAFAGPVPHVINAAGEVTEIVLPEPDDRYEIWDLNNVGQVVGRVGRHNQPEHAFVWQAGVLTMLPDQGAPESLAAGINDRGQIVGALGQRPTLWDGDVIIDITPDSGNRMLGDYAVAINNNGTVVGWFVDVGSRRAGAAYTYDAGVFTWLPGFDNSYPSAINDAGQIAGATTGYYGSGYAAIVWSPTCYGPCCGAP